MCDFPARRLLEIAHQIASNTDPLNFAKLTYACGFIKTVGDLCAYHEYLTGCRCRDEALIEMGWMNEVIGEA